MIGSRRSALPAFAAYICAIKAPPLPRSLESDSRSAFDPSQPSLDNPAGYAGDSVGGRI